MQRNRRTYRVEDFLKDFRWAVGSFYKREGRGFEQFLHGASVHFHTRLITMVRDHEEPPSRWIGEEPYFIELLYAMLTSWGMDSQKARLVDYPEFRRAIVRLAQSDVLQEFEGLSLMSIDASKRDALRRLWELLGRDCKIMRGASIIVGSSKVLHHIVPDVFPPIDGPYTLDLLSHLPPTDSYRISTTQLQRPDFETFYKTMLFCAMVTERVPNIERYVSNGPMSGSVPKVIDNAIIAWWATP